MNRTINVKVEDQFSGDTILALLKKYGYSKQVIIALKKQPKGICVNGVWEHVNFRLTSGDLLTLSLDETESSDIEPVDIPLAIEYEDEDVLVVNKPPFMPTIPSLNHHMDSLANAVCHYYVEKENFVFRAINRLDRNTSGLVLIAKNQISAALLSNQLKAGEIEKKYIALVEGNLEDFAPFPHRIDAPIARQNESLITREVNFDTGQKAITNFSIIEQKDRYAIVSISLETGRTHQIRVHFSYIGHPLLGDEIYGGNTTLMNRHALHCSELKFYQPITGEVIKIETQVPGDMQYHGR